MPTYLNHRGLQSSRYKNDSPSVNLPVTQPRHFGELGQLKNGICWYPISRNLAHVSRDQGHPCLKNLPMNTVRVLKQTKSNAVDWGVAPPLIKETTSAVQVVEIVLVCLAPPEAHVGNLKVTPKVACRISMGLFVVLRATLLVRQKLHSVVLVNVLGMFSDKLLRFGPQRRDRLGRVIQADGEAIGLVVVLHVAEDVVVDITEEVDVRLDAPVILHIGKGGMLIKHAAVPPTHLMVRYLVGILNLLVEEQLHRLLVKILADPRRNLPVLFWNEFCHRVSISTTVQSFHSIPYLHSAFVKACVLFLNSSVKGTSLKKVHG